MTQVTITPAHDNPSQFEHGIGTAGRSSRNTVQCYGVLVLLRLFHQLLCLEPHHEMIETSTSKILKVEIDINKDTILNSPLWTSVPPERGSLKFCVRAELRELETNRSISFYDTKMIV